MTDQRFEYETNDLEDCVNSSLADVVNRTTDSVIISHHDGIPVEEWADRVLLDESCRSLFARHAEHFGRHHSSWDAHYSVEEVDLDGQLVYKYNIGPKLENFVRNVLFINHHNLQVKEGLASHVVALNRFSDMDLGTIVEFVDDPSLQREREQQRSVRKNMNRRRNSSRSLGLQLKILNDRINDNGISSLLSEDGFEDFALIPLLNAENIFHVAHNLTNGNGLWNVFSRGGKRKRKDDDPTNHINVPDKYVDVPMDKQLPFQAPWPDSPETEGYLLSIKRNRAYDRHINPEKSKVFYYDANFDDSFKTYLNWATADNPDGVPIINDAVDQGTCGSCWAFAAAGSLAASAARRAGYMSYTGFLNDHVEPDQKITSDLRKQAVEAAQTVEAETFQMLNLSIQELVDCDMYSKQGCAGGNPLLAFYFLHRYGLTNHDHYPYVGFQDKCRTEVLQNAVATVHSWGVVSPNHENHMELALRFVGPLAVSFNCSEPSFLGYSGGIFDKINCKEGSNTALLVVGYGEEEDRYGRLTKYWIVKNSWGKGWGENGFARIARRGGPKGLPGVCGIARSPSVALGGFVLEQQAVNATHFVDMNAQTTAQVTQSLIGLFLILVSLWLLSWCWRRRIKYRRRRNGRMRVSDRSDSTKKRPHNSDETAPLMQTAARDDAWYGALTPRKRGLAARTEGLLSQLYPRHISDALRDGKKIEPEFHDCVTVYFSDIVGYTTISSTLSPQKVSDLLDRLYTKFDALCGKYNAFKVETVGDAYMVVTNVAFKQPNHVEIIARFALDAVSVATQTLVDVDDPAQGYVTIRAGFHSGPVVSHVVGKRNPRFSIIGDTVNMASLMESNSLPGFIQCSEYSAKLLRSCCNDIDLVCRGEVKIKDKGVMVTYWVRPASEKATPFPNKEPSAKAYGTPGPKKPQRKPSVKVKRKNRKGYPTSDSDGSSRP